MYSQNSKYQNQNFKIKQLLWLGKKIINIYPKLIKYLHIEKSQKQYQRKNI